jgi:hypothetical protein
MYIVLDLNTNTQYIKNIRTCFEITFFILLPVCVLLFYITFRLIFTLLQYNLYGEE